MHKHTDTDHGPTIRLQKNKVILWVVKKAGKVWCFIYWQVMGIQNERDKQI